MSDTVPTIAPALESTLGEKIAAYAELKPRVDELTARLKALSDAIKLELTQAWPGHKTLVINNPAISLRLSYTEPWVLDAKRLKAEDPETYVRFARQSGRWELRQVSG